MPSTHASEELEGLVFSLDLQRVPTILLASSVAEIRDHDLRAHLTERLLDLDMEAHGAALQRPVPGSAFQCLFGVAWRAAFLTRTSFVLGRGRGESEARTDALIAAALIGGLEVPPFNGSLDGLPKEAERLAPSFRLGAPPEHPSTVVGGVVDFVDTGLLFLITEGAGLEDLPLWANPKTPFNQAWAHLEAVAASGPVTVFASLPECFR